MPLTNLCNRLVVNEHPLDPTTLERLALTSLISPSLAAVSPARSYWIEGSEVWGRRRIAREGISDLEQRAGWCRTRQL
jgi:hypothetical protein